VSDTDSKGLFLEMHCSCGALLIVEWPKLTVLDDQRIVGLALAWNTAHAGHHTEPQRRPGL